MYYRNDGSDEINAVQNQFTAYLTKALRNARAQYIRSKVRRLQVELALDEMEYLGITAESQMEQLADAQDLFAALQIMKEKERYVLLARVIEEKGFDVIAAELGMSYRAPPRFTIVPWKNYVAYWEVTGMNFKQLMERAKAGDSAAVTELLMMYRPLLLKEAILDSNLDEDLYQELCLVFLRCIEKFRL